MGKHTIWDQITDFIGGVAFKIFLWSNKKTDEEYWDDIINWEISCNLPSIKKRIKEIENLYVNN